MKSKPSKFPVWFLYLILLSVLLALLRCSDFSAEGWTNLRPNLVAEVAGILVTLGFVEAYLRLSKRANWKGVEKIVRERLISAMYAATFQIEYATQVDELDSFIARVKGAGNNLLPMASHHIELLRDRLIPKVESLAGPLAQSSYTTMAERCDDLASTLDSIIGTYSENLSPLEIERLLTVHRQAGYLKSQLLHCVAVQKSPHESDRGAFDKQCQHVPKTAKAFLEALLAAEECCSEVYEQNLSASDR